MKLLLLALDGFDPHLFALWRDRLPHLSAIANQGVWGSAASTMPPMTFPAWSSFLTGANPGQHGIFDFTELLPDRRAVRFLNATRRRLPTFLRLASDAGLKVGSVGLPTTYPPEPLSGYQISGFDTPLPSKADATYMHPPELAAKITRGLGGYFFGNFNESRLGKDWHVHTLDSLLAGLKRKSDLARFLHKEYPVDVMLLHIGETDTVGHHYWAFHDRQSPRHVLSSDPRLSTAIFEIYRAADHLVGAMLEMTQPETTMIISDHGMGGTSDRVLYLNRYLEKCGLLKFTTSTDGARFIGKLKTAGLKWMPYRWQQSAFKLAGGRLASAFESRQRFGGIDWVGTMAYSEELNYFPAIRLNRGGGALGDVVRSEEVSSLTDRTRAALLEWRDPKEGNPVVAAVHTREEIYEGPETTFAPDLILELNRPEGYSYALGRSTSPEGLNPWRKMRTVEYLGFKGASMNGSHRSEGIFMMQGSKAISALPDDFSLLEVAPLILKTLDVDVPVWMKRPSAPKSSGVESAAQKAPEIPYNSSQEEALHRQLVSLGYL